MLSETPRRRMLPDLHGIPRAFGCAPESGTTSCGLNQNFDVLRSSFVIIGDLAPSQQWRWLSTQTSLADVLKNAIELIKRAVTDNQAPFTTGPMLQLHFRPQTFPQVLLQTLDIGIGALLCRISFRA